MISSNKVVVTAATAIGVLAATYWAYSSWTSGKKSSKSSVVFVLGGPGSGKGTNCARIVELFGYTHLSAGDLLRDERKSGSALAEMIESYIKEGKIVPAEVTVDLLRKAMQKSGNSKFLVDGFPRDMDNLRCWEQKMTDVANVKFLLYLSCPQEIMLARLLERGKTSGRSDDNADSIKKRFETYESQTKPIIEHFTKLGKTKEVNSNRDIEVVFTDVSKHFQA